MKRTEKTVDIGAVVWSLVFIVIPIICVMSLVLAYAPILVSATAKLVFEVIGALTLIPTLIALYCYLTR